MDSGAIQQTHIKIARTSSTKDKAVLTIIAYTVEKPEALHVLKSRVTLPLTTFPDGGFVQLAIIAPHPLEQIARSRLRGQGVATDTASVDHMSLVELVSNPALFRQVAIGQMHLGKLRLYLLIDGPSHAIHVRGIAQTDPSPLDLVFLMTAMNQVVTGLTQRDEILRTIPSGLSRLNVMHIQDRVFGLAVAPLTAVAVPGQDVLAHIPEAQLGSLLVLLASDLRMADLLEIELCDLNGDLADGQELMTEADGLQMHLDFVLHRGSQPALSFKEYFLLGCG